MSDSVANKEIVRRAYEAMTVGDIRGFIAALDEHIEVHEPEGLPHGGRYVGLDDLKQMFGKAAPVLDVGKLELHELTAEEDRVVALLRIPLRNGGGTALISEHWRLRGGKAVELQAFWFDAGLASTGFEPGDS
jgi:ketosteroid isomerase-like protein